jgi:hypothetical protein
MSAHGYGHREAAQRWPHLTLMEQLAHVGSDVERSIRAHEAGNVARFENALARALELFELTAADERWRGPRRREILRAREEFCRLFFGDDDVGKSALGLRKYFLSFAVAARRQRPSGSE